MAEWLQRQGHAAELFAAQRHASDSAVQATGDLLPEELAPGDALFLHHCLRSDEWERLLQDRNYCRVLRYHGVTPEDFFRRVSPWHAGTARAGRRQTAEIARCGCEMYLATSEFTRRELIALGAPAERCLVVPPFHRVERLLRLAPNRHVADRFADGRYNLVSVGVLAPHKNQTALVRAFAALPAQVREGARLILVGAHDPLLAQWTARVRALVAKLGLGESVVLAGRVGEEELAAYYRVADMFVSASLHEGFGVPLVEAMAFGVPIVALSAAAVPETVGDAGLLVPRYEEEGAPLCRGVDKSGQSLVGALSDAIAVAITDDDLRDNLTSAGHARYEAEFSEPALGRKLQAAMDRLERIAVERRTTTTTRGTVTGIPRRGRRSVPVADSTKGDNSQPGPLNDECVVVRTDAYLRRIEPYSERFHSRGIVICAGGVRYLTCAWVLIKQLRSTGCQLPIQVWHRDAAERDRGWGALIKPLGVECVDAESVCAAGRRPCGGWELKSYAMLHSPFEEVLLLDADNVPVADPTYLFDEPEYRRLGAIFWPDGSHTPPDAPQWRIFNAAYRDEPEQESGQILVDKRRCWRALNLANWFNEHSGYFYRVIYGDKDTFRFAWHRLGQAFAMPARPIEVLPMTLCQHDLKGRRIFQHRVHDKWSLGGNLRVPGFLYEAECFEFIAELARRWDVVGSIAGRLGRRDRQRMRELAGRPFVYVRLGSNRWPMRLDGRGRVIEGHTPRELFWWRHGDRLLLAGGDGLLTCELHRRADGVWDGMSLRDSKQQCQLLPVGQGLLD